MSDVSRRNLIGTAAVAGGLVSTTALADPFAETPQPPSGPVPAPLAGAELPSFRYALGAQPAQALDGGTAKEASVKEFPVSKRLPAC